MEKLNKQIQEQLNSNLIESVLYGPVMYQSAKHRGVPGAVGLHRQHLAFINQDLNISNGHVYSVPRGLCFLNNNDPRCVRN